MPLCYTPRKACTVWSEFDPYPQSFRIDKLNEKLGTPEGRLPPTSTELRRNQSLHTLA